VIFIVDHLLKVLGGSSLLDSIIFQGLTTKTVTTPYGDALLHFSENFIFVQRHHADPKNNYTQPHLINFRVNSNSIVSQIRRLLCMLYI
jgi:hypothetical protein